MTSHTHPVAGRGSAARQLPSSAPGLGEWAGVLIEWHLYREFLDLSDTPAGSHSEPWSADRAPEHQLRIPVYGRCSTGRWVWPGEVDAVIMPADLGLVIDEDGWLDIDEQQTTRLLQRIFPGAELRFAPEGDDAVLGPIVDQDIGPIYDLELCAADAQPAHRGGRCSRLRRDSGSPPRAQRIQPKRTSRRQRRSRRAR